MSLLRTYPVGPMIRKEFDHPDVRDFILSMFEDQIPPKAVEHCIDQALYERQREMGADLLRMKHSLLEARGLIEGNPLMCQFRGIAPVGSEIRYAADGKKMRNLASFIRIMREVPDNHPDKRWYFENIWPSVELIPEFESTTRLLHSQVNRFFCRFIQAANHHITPSNNLLRDGFLRAAHGGPIYDGWSQYQNIYYIAYQRLIELFPDIHDECNEELIVNYEHDDSSAFTIHLESRDVMPPGAALRAWLRLRVPRISSEWLEERVLPGEVLITTGHALWVLLGGKVLPDFHKVAALLWFLERAGTQFFMGARASMRPDPDLYAKLPSEGVRWLPTDTYGDYIHKEMARNAPETILHNLDHSAPHSVV